ncbi:unnamed protein product [Prorocentrum cordatum]|uniref:Cellulase n=1 Tax=Prorocentrum cordatum TaxID=2364126 RepID=A0ABN9V6Z7_9DINO|nr:unnamed protein product [Polarella glacialis]
MVATALRTRALAAAALAAAAATAADGSAPVPAVPPPVPTAATTTPPVATSPPKPPPQPAPTRAPTGAPAPAPGPSPGQDATPTPPAVRHTWNDCLCKASWEQGGVTCSDGCCNLDDDEWGDYCYVEDPECEDFEWGYCRPETMTRPGCTDYPPGWSDSDGDECYSYEFNEFCTASGGYGPGWDQGWGTFGSFAMGGYDASTACCSCGGGSDINQGYNDNRCADTDGWRDTDGDACSDYSQFSYCTTTGQPGIGWHAQWGTLSDFQEGGKSAVEACCSCGGGSTGTYTGTQYTPTPNDYGTAEVEVPSDVAWAVVSGPCTKDRSDCILSPNYPKTYGDDEKCVIGVNVDKISHVTADTFSTEWGYDVLKINGQTYSGTLGPSSVKPLGPIVWTSDFESALNGWRLCPPGAAPFEEEGAGASGSGSRTLSVLVAMGILALVAGACWRRMRGTADTGLGEGMPRNMSAERRRMEG